MKTKIRILRIVALVLIFIGFGCMGVLAHEAGHLIINNALGGSGEIFYHWSLTAGHMDWITLPLNHIWLVYLGGGLFAAIFLSLFFGFHPGLLQVDKISILRGR